MVGFGWKDWPVYSNKVSFAVDAGSAVPVVIFFSVYYKTNKVAKHRSHCVISSL